MYYTLDFRFLEVTVDGSSGSSGSLEDCKDFRFKPDMSVMAMRGFHLSNGSLMQKVGDESPLALKFFFCELRHHFAI